jgi:hypothetical protein
MPSKKKNSKIGTDLFFLFFLFEWAAGKLKQATVTCISGGTGTLRYGDKVVKLDMQPGQEIKFNANLGEQ